MRKFMNMKKVYMQPQIEDIDLQGESMMVDLIVSPGVHNDLVGAPGRGGYLEPAY